MAKKPEPPKRASKITIPDRCHPIAKIVFAEMQRQGMTYDDLEWKSGVLKSTFKAWRTDNRPGLDTAEAALGALGWSILPVPKLENLPAPVRALLDDAAGLWGEINPLLMELMRTVSKTPIVQAVEEGAVVARITPRKTPRRRWSHPDQIVLLGEVAA